MGKRAIVEIVVERLGFLLTLVRDRDERVLLERHREEAIESVMIGDGEKLGLPSVVVAEAEAKEIAERSFDAGRGFLVPVNPQHEFFQMQVFAAGERE